MTAEEKIDGSSSSNVNQTSEGKPKASLRDPHTSSCGSRTCEPSRVTENTKCKMPSVDKEKESDVILSE